ncbi:G/U mismatch-specific DNA glycosylase [Duganella callida]|uniref:G/U mismatch-specific DNA glycosylase n=1 Tax=Duganella callida TaxID=2561932 RepID=A0A4Y9SVQ5_9BURK|nr:G/U mismatch-specific DNA glycosylase [Duganella callida]TFW29294.1 G/U mismatch-specific DNA glycosylase [Duganella callida]
MSNIEDFVALPDILAPALRVVFCGINPGVEAATCGHHFLGRGNRFWPVLHEAGFTPHRLVPGEDRDVLAYGIGLTTAVARPTHSAAQLRQEEFAASAAALLDKLARYRPQCIAFLGKAAYLGITGQRDAAWGAQDQPLGPSRVWLLPNPSGLNRTFSRQQLVDAYSALNRSLSLRR